MQVCFNSAPVFAFNTAVLLRSRELYFTDRVSGGNETKSGLTLEKARTQKKQKRTGSACRNVDTGNNYSNLFWKTCGVRFI